MKAADAKPTIFHSWRQLKGLEMPKPEYIINGLIRGELGLLQAITNIGKTTLSLNLSICLATGRPFAPLVEAGPPRRILYLDYETSMPASKMDLSTMESVLTPEEMELFLDNFIIYNYQNPDSEDLILTEEGKLEKLAQIVLENKIDLVIIDPISLAFPGVDEQSNDEVQNKILRPLQTFPKIAGGCSVLYTHHIGKEKSEEGHGGGRNDAYRSRGASSFGTLSRVILQLDKRTVGHQQEVVLSYVKSKTAEEIRPVFIELDREARWFTVLRSEPEVEETPLEALVRSLGELNGAAKRAELAMKVGGKMSKTTVDRYLAKAVESGDIIKSEEVYGLYHLPGYGPEPGGVKSLVSVG